MIKLLKQIILSFPNLPLAIYVRDIENNLDNCNSILDVGCGEISPLRLLSKKYLLTGVDGYEESLIKSKRRHIHDKYVHLDVRKLSTKFKPKSYDAVIALDVIEHLTEKEGLKLLKDMEKIAKRVVILNTPNGYIPQVNKENKLQDHHSAWDTKDFTKLGYKVYGMYGLKQLRGEGGALKLKPKTIFGSISLMSHYLFSKNNPDSAFSLLAVKKIS